MSLEELAERKWFLALIFLIYFIPPVTSKPYDYRFTWRVVAEVLNYSLKPYLWLAPVFHLATLALLVAIIVLKDRVTRLFYGYFGLNFLFIALVQSTAKTEKYGFSVLLGGLITFVVVSVFWLWELKARKASFVGKPCLKRFWVVPLAFLAFWAPVGVGGKPDLSLKYLLFSYYGLAFCLTTPVALAFLVLYYPRVNIATMRVTGFMGALLGVLNYLMGLTIGNLYVGVVLHTPLLFISCYSLYLTRRR